MKKFTWILVLLVLGMPNAARAQSPAPATVNDPVWDGAFKGAIWGGVTAVGLLMTAYYTNNAPHGCNGDCLAIVAGTVGAGAAIGLGLDALVSHRITIHTPTPPSQGFPGAARSARNIGVGVRWRF